MAENGVRTVNMFDLLGDDTPQKPKKKSNTGHTQKPRTNKRRGNERAQGGNRSKGHGGQGSGGHSRGGQGRARGHGGHGHGRRQAGDGRRQFDRRNGPNRNADRSSANSQHGWGDNAIDEHNKMGEPQAMDAPFADEGFGFDVPANNSNTKEEGKEEKKTEEEIAEEKALAAITYEQFLKDQADKQVQAQVEIRSTLNEGFKGHQVTKLKKKENKAQSRTGPKKKGGRATPMHLDQFTPLDTKRKPRNNRDNRDNRQRNNRDNRDNRQRNNNRDNRDNRQRNNRDNRQRKNRDNRQRDNRDYGNNRSNQPRDVNMNLTDEDNFPGLG